MAADRSSVFDEVFAYESVFKSIFFVSMSVRVFSWAKSFLYL